MRYSGIIEVLGLPTRPKLKNAANIARRKRRRRRRRTSTTATATYGARFKEDRTFALAAASLRQAMQDMPEITEVSKHIMIEETKEGLNIEIVDQDGRSMFPDGSKEPYRAHPPADPEAGAAAEGDAVPHLDLRPHRGQQGAAAARLRTLGTVRRPRQCGARRFWTRKACRRATSSWSPARPTPSRCSRTIPRCRRTAA